MLQIALCDDDAAMLLRLEAMIDQWCTAHGSTARTAAFPSGEALLHAVADGAGYDLYILDVLMPKLNGIALGKKLRATEMTGHDAPIIYLSSSRDFAVNSYEVRAFYYLLKPVSYEKFDEILSEAAKEADRSRTSVIPVRTRSGTYPVTYDEICYVILENRALTYLCFDRQLTSMTIPGSFRSATMQLTADPRFFLCGASMLVNLRQIQSIDRAL